MLKLLLPLLLFVATVVVVKAVVSVSVVVVDDVAAVAVTVAVVAAAAVAVTAVLVAAIAACVRIYNSRSLPPLPPPPRFPPVINEASCEAWHGVVYVFVCLFVCSRPNLRQGEIWMQAIYSVATDLEMLLLRLLLLLLLMMMLLKLLLLKLRWQITAMR